jgi:hypothetical protein
MSIARRILVVAAAWLGMLAVSIPASATAPIDTAEAALQTANLYVDPQAAKEIKIERPTLASAIPDKVKIAVLPKTAGSPTALAGQIIAALDPSRKGLTVGVFVSDASGYLFGADSSASCVGYASEKARAADRANRSQLLANHDVTPLLADFAQSVADGPRLGTSACGSAAGGAAASPKKSDNGSGAWPWIIGIGVVGAGGIGGLAWYRRRQKKRELDLARAKVMPYYDRLASEVSSLDPKDDDTALQAIADASERFDAAGSQLATADSVEKFAQARRTTLEGLHAAVTARKALGLDPGPELPPIDSPRGEQLAEAREVNVQGKAYQGYPDYTPGAPYYYGGGYGVPGGWYATPFWETLLIGSVLTGGLGGWGGGGYGSGYDSGYQSGYDAGQGVADDQGTGDVGSDWGSGSVGSDWGGGDVGGDWGGGGDSGGGDSGGSW